MLPDRDVRIIVNSRWPDEPGEKGDPPYTGRVECHRFLRTESGLPNGVEAPSWPVLRHWLLSAASDMAQLPRPGPVENVFAQDK